VETNVSKTSDGGFVIGIRTNSTPGTGNIDSFCTSSLSGDRALYLKYNSDASILEWSKCSLKNGFMYPQSDGSFIFGTETSISGMWSFDISKENAAGSVLWNKTYGDTASARLRGMIATSDGGFIMMGLISSSDTNFTVHYGSFTDDDIAVIKVDSAGNKVWARVLGGSAEDAAVALISAPGDGCYVVGTTLSTDHDFSVNHGGDDAFLVRLDKNGTIVWRKCIGGSAGDEADCASSNGKGGAIIGGASNSLDGDRTHFPSFGCPVWAFEIDSNSNIVWNNCFGGGGGNCYANAICKATDGSIWIAGVSSVTGEEVDTNYGKDDAWFIHADSAGSFLNEKVLGSHLWDKGMMVYPLSNGNVIAGGFYDTAGGAFSSVTAYASFPDDNAFLTIFQSYAMGVQQAALTPNPIKMYPNPARSELNLEASEKLTQDILITDVLGKTIYTGVFTDKAKIPVTEWRAGVYCVEVNK
jgi:hypothetical protein